MLNGQPVLTEGGFKHRKFQPDDTGQRQTIPSARPWAVATHPDYSAVPDRVRHIEGLEIR